MNKKIILLFLPFLFIASLAFAETIQLKSGKTVEGNVIDKTGKYIKVDIGVGIPIIYFFDEISTINGQEINETKSSDAKVAPAENAPPQKSDKEAVVDFLKQFKASRNSYKTSDDALTQKYDEAKLENQDDELLDILRQKIDNRKQFIAEIEKLSTPAPCEKLKAAYLEFVKSVMEENKYTMAKAAPRPDSSLEDSVSASGPETAYQFKRGMLFDKFNDERNRLLAVYNIDWDQL